MMSGEHPQSVSTHHLFTSKDTKDTKNTKRDSIAKRCEKESENHAKIVSCFARNLAGVGFSHRKTLFFLHRKTRKTRKGILLRKGAKMAKNMRKFFLLRSRVWIDYNV